MYTRASRPLSVPRSREEVIASLQISNEDLLCWWSVVSRGNTLFYDSLRLIITHLDVLISETKHNWLKPSTNLYLYITEERIMAS